MKTVAAIVSLFLGVAMANAQKPSIHYTLGMSRPSTHLFEVEVRVGDLPSGDKDLELVMPAWRSGRYVIFDFAGSVQEFSASDDRGNALSWMKTDKGTWRIERGKTATIVAKYLVYANEFGDRTKGLNDEHAFVDPATTFMFLGKYKRNPLTATIIPFGDWHATTGLEEAEGKKNEFSAPTYEYFADCPIEVGMQKDYAFDVDGTHHVLMVAGETNLDVQQAILDLTKLVKANKEFWGRLPYTRYIFMLETYPNMGGGTEHINSTIMQTSPFGFTNPDRYKGFIGLVSHEYFHTWNVKQLRPKGITPYDYTKEAYVKELWVAEGTTSYYGDLLMVRTGFTQPQDYLNRVASGVQGDRMRPGNKIQSVTESSFDAWVKYWRGQQNSYNSESDYYDKGLHVSLILDLAIRHTSGNKHSLDDVMRAMFERYPLGTGYTVDDLQQVSEEMAGGSLQKFFADYVHGTTPIPWEDLLSYAGLRLEKKDAPVKPWLGVNTRDQGGTAQVWSVIAGSPAYDAGINVNDEILALNGFRVRTNDIGNRIGEMKAGDTIRLTVFRNERLREFSVVLRNPDVPAYQITKTSNPSDLQKKIYQDWLKTNW
ncbi:MAG TPA: PDZ domain-containing protein [Bacteroidota bacterium]|nr:PDZ domain-containing protein [Bacteroidota bacterium]